MAQSNLHKNRVRRRFFTLPEIIIIFLLMSLSFAVLIIPSRCVWKKKKYEYSIGEVINRLQLAKRVAYGYDTVVKVHLGRSSKGYLCRMEFEEEYAGEFGRFAKPICLEGVDAILEGGEEKEDGVVIEYIAKLGPKKLTYIELCARFTDSKDLVFAID